MSTNEKDTVDTNFTDACAKDKVDGQHDFEERRDIVEGWPAIRFRRCLKCGRIEYSVWFLGRWSPWRFV